MAAMGRVGGAIAPSYRSPSFGLTASGSLSSASYAPSHSPLGLSLKNWQGYEFIELSHSGIGGVVECRVKYSL